MAASVPPVFSGRASGRSLGRPGAGGRGRPPLFGVGSPSASVLRPLGASAARALPGRSARCARSIRPALCRPAPSGLSLRSSGAAPPLRAAAIGGAALPGGLPPASSVVGGPCVVGGRASSGFARGRGCTPYSTAKLHYLPRSPLRPGPLLRLPGGSHRPTVPSPHEKLPTRRTKTRRSLRVKLLQNCSRNFAPAQRLNCSGGKTQQNIYLFCCVYSRFLDLFTISLKALLWRRFSCSSASLRL